MTNDPSSTAGEPGEPRVTYREVKYRHSRDFVKLMDSLGASLLVSTYQAGKLVAVGTHEARLAISLHNFEQAMGIAVHPQRIAVGSRGVIWFLQNAPEFAPRLDPPGRYDACYLARGSFISGNIHGHEMAWVGDELWIVNTLFSCLCTLHDEYSFIPRWQPPFISALEANDRCHLNGMALDAGQPKYVTAMAETDTPGGWRPEKATSGVIVELASGQVVSRGLSMPHSPRVYGGRLWVLNSGLGSLEVVDPRTGQREVVTKVPGYTRGLAFCGQFAFVGMSRIRETAVFGGVPIAENREELKCAVAVVDLRAGQAVAFLEFETGVEEVFDVQVLAGTKCVSLTGPYPAQDDAKDIWILPPLGQVPAVVASGRRATIPGMSATREQPRSDQQIAELVKTSVAAHQQGRPAEAAEGFQRALAARPGAAEIHNHLGNALQDLGRQDQALECYRRAIGVQENFAPAHQNMGYLLVNFGRLDEGLKHIERAQQIHPSDMNRVMLATSLPVIYASTDEVKRRREQLEANVGRLLDDGVAIDTTHTTIPTNFFAAYQGYDDCSLQRNIARLYRAPQLAERKLPARQNGRLRIGFLSAHLRDHTIGRLNLGRIALLDRERFDVTIFAVGRHSDAMAGEFRGRVEHYMEVNGPIDEVRRHVAGARLDVLMMPEVGMNSMTYTLALSRMAPIQCVGWGHPITTGSPAVDYYLSSQLLETDEADSQYSERLIRFANLATYYYRPKLAGGRRTRESFGLDASRHIYFCPQTLFKLHPEFDGMLAEILRRDGAGELVLIEGRQPQWTRLVQERFARTMPDVAARVRFLPPLPNSDFLELNALADVLVDPIHFGGGNTSYEGLALGTPIVTLPGPYLRSRITLALYRKMQYSECIAAAPEEYIAKAVRLGTDRDYRKTVSEQILAASDVLYEDPAEAREFARFFTWLADGAPEPWRVSG